MTDIIETRITHGAEIAVPLNKLKKSPNNARRTPHTEAAIEALAASIAAKGILQAPRVEPERDGEGRPTSFWLVSIGEGRRLAQCLRAKRKEIKTSEPIRCIVDLDNDAHEISLDENVTRSAMHPADEFEAFRDLAEQRGFGPEEIGARFGVTPQVVRQRLRLGTVASALMAIYRDGELTLDQLMAFGVSEDRARQEQVFEQLGPYNRAPSAIRRAMTEAKVAATDRRAVFVGLDAYAEAGGAILRDLFTEDRGGWLEDVVLLDRMVAEKLAGIAKEVREREGWKWTEAHLDYPASHTCSRIYPSPVERSEAEKAEIDTVSTEYDALVAEWSHLEELPPEIEARLAEIDAKLDAFGDGYAFALEEIARAGVFVVLSHDGSVRIERGNVRREDVPVRQPVLEEGGSVETSGEPPVSVRAMGEAEAVDEEPDGLTPLPDRLVADLTAHRTAGLRDALANDPDAAFLVAVQAAVLRTFYPAASATCADLRFLSAPLSRDAEGIDDSPAAKSTAERHEAWGRHLPQDATEIWAFVVALDGDSRTSLFAHCVSLTINAVRGWERRPQAWAHADDLAAYVGLDMTRYWTASVRSYFGRVTKARIGEAVGEAVSVEAAERIAGMKKPELAEAAEQLVAGRGWLPPLLRTQGVAEPAEAFPIATE